MSTRSSARRSWQNLFPSGDGGDCNADASPRSTPPKIAASAATPNATAPPAQNALPVPEVAKEAAGARRRSSPVPIERSGEEEEGAEPLLPQPQPRKTNVKKLSRRKAKSKLKAQAGEANGLIRSDSPPKAVEANNLPPSGSPSEATGEAKNLSPSQSPYKPHNAKNLPKSPSSKLGESTDLPRSQSPSNPSEATDLPRSQAQAPSRSASPSKSGESSPSKLRKAQNLPQSQSPSKHQKVKNLPLSPSKSGETMDLPQAQSPSDSGLATDVPQAQPPSNLGEVPSSQLGEPKNPAPTQEKRNKKRKLGTQEKRNNKKRKFVTFERVWSRADELRIVEAMAKHAESHGGTLPETSDLFATLGSSLDNRDNNLPKLADKVRKLKRRYDNAQLKGCPTDDDGRQLFELCEKVWGAASTALRRSTRKIGGGQIAVEEARRGGEGGDEDAGKQEGNIEQSKDVTHQAEVVPADVEACRDKAGSFKEDGDVSSGAPKDKMVRVRAQGPVKAASVRRELSELSVLYPSLMEEVKAHANDCGELIITAFEFIGDDEARYLDARCKKIRIDKLNLKKDQASLTKLLLCTLKGLIS